jgi:hypothetical protein
MLALLVCVAGTLVGVRFPAPITIISAIALGVAGTLGYQYLAPIVSSVVRRRWGRDPRRFCENTRVLGAFTKSSATLPLARL